MQEFETRNPAAHLLKRVLSPLQKFIQMESASGLLLIATTVIAMLWANSPWAEAYHHLIELPLGFSAGAFSIEKSLHHWVNDGLMVIFFFVVGCEIKRELLAGELASPKKAALPIFAALGGMLVPALIYATFNIGTPYSHGWGIPMATDIAFAVGVLALLKGRVPASLVVFLLALAIVDDLGAVVVIAVFYSSELHMAALAAGAGLLGLIWILRFAGVRFRPIFLILSVGVWFAILKSGIHATIAGVALGFLTPLRPLIPEESLSDLGTPLLRQPTTQNIDKLQFLVDESRGPLERSVNLLHPWVNFLIMPVFALVNAGIPLHDVPFEGLLQNPITLGVALGLVLGKPIGVVLFAFLSCVLGIGQLPREATWAQMIGVGCLAGIGFTMALFVSGLSFTGAEEPEMFAKIGILMASIVAAVLGSALLLVVPAKRE